MLELFTAAGVSIIGLLITRYGNRILTKIERRFTRKRRRRRRRE
jgi:hypothetical protein